MKEKEKAEAKKREQDLRAAAERRKTVKKPLSQPVERNPGLKKKPKPAASLNFSVCF